MGSRLKKPWHVKATILEEYKPFEESEHKIYNCFFDNYENGENIIFNIAFFGTKFTLNILNSK